VWASEGFRWQSRGSNFAIPRSRCLDDPGNGASGISLSFVGALANELSFERTRDDDGAFTALPLLKFAGTKLVRMAAFTFAAMAAVPGESHTLITPNCTIKTLNLL
jgi:hypothetical protein